MVGSVEIGELRRGRRWTIASADGAAGLMGLSIVVDEPDRERDALTLTSSEVTDGLAGRLWRGVLSNMGSETCRGLAAEIRFLDRAGRVSGRLDARAANLPPGGGLQLEALLPSGAARLQIYALRWRTGTASIELGPFSPQPLPRPAFRTAAA